MLKKKKTFFNEHLVGGTKNIFIVSLPRSKMSHERLGDYEI